MTQGKIQIIIHIEQHPEFNGKGKFVTKGDKSYFKMCSIV